MKKRLIAVFCSAVIIMIVVTACGITPLEKRGTLMLTLSSTPLLTLRTIVPDFNMVPKYYSIYGTGPGGASFEQTWLETSAAEQAALVPGEWLIEVDAYNSERIQIGAGQARVTVLPGVVVDVTVIVEPLPGTGQLNVIVTWPPDVLIEPMVEGTLTPAPGGIRFITAEDELSADYLSPDMDSSTALRTGYYTLAIQLSTKRSDGSGRDTVWGAVEAVRIVKGQVSRKLFELVEDVNRGGITIQNEFDNPFTVTISGVDPRILVGDRIAAVAEPAGADGYAWYLDGIPLESGGDILIEENRIIINGGVELGHHW